MKKLTAFLLSLLMICSFTACSENKNTDNADVITELGLTADSKDATSHTQSV